MSFFSHCDVKYLTKPCHDDIIRLVDVHLSYVEIVIKKGEICPQKLRDDQKSLNFWSWPVHDIACDTESPSKVEVK
jgi:hypothetical protein